MGLVGDDLGRELADVPARARQAELVGRDLDEDGAARRLARLVDRALDRAGRVEAERALGQGGEQRGLVGGLVQRAADDAGALEARRDVGRDDDDRACARPTPRRSRRACWRRRDQVRDERDADPAGGAGVAVGGVDGGLLVADADEADRGRSAAPPRPGGCGLRGGRRRPRRPRARAPRPARRRRWAPGRALADDVVQRLAGGEAQGAGRRRGPTRRGRRTRCRRRRGGRSGRRGPTRAGGPPGAARGRRRRARRAGGPDCSSARERLGVGRRAAAHVDVQRAVGELCEDLGVDEAARGVRVRQEVDERVGPGEQLGELVAKGVGVGIVVAGAAGDAADVGPRRARAAARSPRRRRRSRGSRP